MNDTREQKEARLREYVHTAVAKLLAMKEDRYGKTVTTECHRVAVEVGNMMAPQLYGNRGHGVSNAVSICVRLCSEALFWLDTVEQKPNDIVQSVESLLTCLSAPSL